MEDEETDPATTPPEEAAEGGSSVPDAAVVSLVDAVSHALDSTNNNNNNSDQQQAAGQLNPLGPPPAPLPLGWILRESRSQPNYYYYYNMETGISQWHSPVEELLQPALDEVDVEEEAEQEVDYPPQQQDTASKALEGATSTGSDSSGGGENRKRPLEENYSGTEAVTATKKAKTSSSSNGSGKPSKVRILHILKKHKDSRRPSSWRQPKITATKEEATEELQGLMEILQEETGEDQRATFEEIARTESDCSSAKRGGDLGYFGPKKMQPAFEEASFALKVGELSGIVETSSGVHVLLRIG